MKRIALLFLIFTCSVFGQTYYLNVWSKGKLTSIPVTEIRKLTFLNITAIEGTEKQQELITAFELFQNYPNPFNPTTRIDYQINNAGHVDVQIYNVLGKLIKTITSTEQSAGKYSVTWNGKDNDNKPVASGMYIYRVMFGNTVLSKKMLLLK